VLSELVLQFSVLSFCSSEKERGKILKRQMREAGHQWLMPVILYTGGSHSAWASRDVFCYKKLI
jgi:hypothetical protein